MGSTFANVNLRRKETVTRKSVSDYICKIMRDKGYMLTESGEEAQVSFALCASRGGEWVTVYSDDLRLFDDCNKAYLAKEMSQELSTDALNIVCYDSDYLSMNLVNSAENTDLWASVGEFDYGEARESVPEEWAGKIADIDTFKSAFEKDYVFAEEVLSEISKCINLSEKYSAMSYDYLEDSEIKDVTYLLFAHKSENEKLQGVHIEEYLPSLTPCRMGNTGAVGFINKGSESKGLSVFFVGDYVENDEITFTDVTFNSIYKNEWKTSEIELKKIKLASGKFAYYGKDEEFIIPHTIETKRGNEKTMVVRFVPQGNSRKVLDIAVVIAPLENQDNHVYWNVWWRNCSKSKREYIEKHNEEWRELVEEYGAPSRALLNPDDYDLD